MSKLYALRDNNYLNIKVRVHYAKNNVPGIWAVDIKRADSLNIFEAKRIVQEYKLKDYDLIKLKE